MRRFSHCGPVQRAVAIETARDFCHFCAKPIDKQFFGCYNSNILKARIEKEYPYRGTCRELSVGARQQALGRGNTFRELRTEHRFSEK